MANARINRKAFQALFNQEDRNDEIIYDLSRMTKRKQFASWVLDMWRLWKSLSKNDTSILIELFPDFANRLTTTGGDKMLQAIYDQQATIIKKLDSGMTLAAPAPFTGGLKSMNVPQIAMPTFDDEDEIKLVVNKDASAPGKLVSNFMDSVLGLQKADGK